MSDPTSSEQRVDDAQPDGASRREFLQYVTIGGAAVAAIPLLEGCATDDQQKTAHGPSTTMPSQPVAGELHRVELEVNGKTVALMLETRVTLLDALREYAGLTGTKKGCDHGQCGACTVLLNDRRVNACLTLALAAQGQKITTIEGLANGDDLHPMQSAFIKHDAFQCGYCTPGQICSAVGLLNEGHAHSDDEIRESMSGNICRCGAYPNILAAVKEVVSAKA